MSKHKKMPLGTPSRPATPDALQHVTTRPDAGSVADPEIDTIREPEEFPADVDEIEDQPDAESEDIDVIPDDIPEESAPQEEGKKTYRIPWEGAAVAHACPACHTRYLLDRSTKACVVNSTGQEQTDGTRRIRERKMKCCHCGLNFIAEEKNSF